MKGEEEGRRRGKKEGKEGGGGPPHQWNMTSGNDLKVKKTACAVMRRCLTRLTIRLIMKTITKMARHVQLQHLPHRLHGVLSSA